MVLRSRVPFTNMVGFSRISDIADRCLQSRILGKFPCSQGTRLGNLPKTPFHEHQLPCEPSRRPPTLPNVEKVSIDILKSTIHRCSNER
jgi:hypothetical protein